MFNYFYTFILQSISILLYIIIFLHINMKCDTYISIINPIFVADNRGFMTQNGQPDNPRSARYILKDFVNGKLLYCVAPPTLEQECFHVFPPRRRNLSANRHIPPRTARVNQGCGVTVNKLDREFFQDAHMKGRRGPVLQHLIT